ncbi:hypothetical protein AB0H51_27935 [Streptomyces griseoluteus]|uniref:hypothetical protein n=1 Tax=Streptomyces griseoluteus TaxID=29306 RepID=UPI0033C4C71B
MTPAQKRRLCRTLARRAGLCRLRKRLRRLRTRVEAWALVALCLALTVVAICAAAGAARSDDAPHKRPTTVTITTGHRAATDGPSFNEGFADSKRDDCQQGFQPACAWLRDAAKK